MTVPAQQVADCPPGAVFRDDGIRRALGQLSPISLAELDAVSLLERRDTKYVVGRGQVPALIDAVRGEYRALEIGGQRVHRYETTYFDTPAFALYHAHHRDRPTHYKVRTRFYRDSELVFFEVKTSSYGNRTSKARVLVTSIPEVVPPEGEAVLPAELAHLAQALRPVLRNRFSRSTLASVERRERVTIDFGLQFSAGNVTRSVPGAAIVEIKEGLRDRSSPMAGLLRSLGAHAVSISKYCVGAAQIYDLKQNRFKPQLLTLARMTEGT